MNLYSKIYKNYGTHLDRLMKKAGSKMPFKLFVKKIKCKQVLDTAEFREIQTIIEKSLAHEYCTVSRIFKNRDKISGDTVPLKIA